MSQLCRHLLLSTAFGFIIGPALFAQDSEEVLKVERLFEAFYPYESGVYQFVKQAMFSTEIDKSLIDDEMAKELLNEGFLTEGKVPGNFKFRQGGPLVENRQDGTIHQRLRASCYVRAEGQPDNPEVYIEFSAVYKNGEFRSGRLTAYNTEDSKKRIQLFSINWEFDGRKPVYTNAILLNSETGKLMKLNEKGEREGDKK